MEAQEEEGSGGKGEGERGLHLSQALTGPRAQSFNFFFFGGGIPLLSLIKGSENLNLPPFLK